MDRIALHSFMARHRYGVISSTSGDNTPQSALVGIAITPDLEIIFDTVKSSRKYRNLIARPACSFVVCRSGEEQREVESYFDSLILSCRGSLGLSAERPYSEPDLYLGTSAFTASVWQGSFYPKAMQPHEYLSHYAQTFRTVEVRGNTDLKS